jgi:hypothetical protein
MSLSVIRRGDVVAKCGVHRCESAASDRIWPIWPESRHSRHDRAMIAAKEQVRPKSATGDFGVV